MKRKDPELIDLVNERMKKDEPKKKKKKKTVLKDFIDC